MSRYFVKLGNEKTGPFQFPALKTMAEAGTIAPLDLVSLDGSEWRQARFIPELFSQEALLHLTSQERTQTGKIPLDQEGDKLLRRKTIFAVAGAAWIFGIILGWGIMFIPNSKYSKLETQLGTLQEENEKLVKNFAGSITKDEHSRLSNQQMELYAKLEKDLKDSLTTFQEGFAKAKADHQQSMNRLRDEAKGFADKAKDLEKAVEPVRELITRLPEDPGLLELLQKIQKVSADELGSTLKDLQKALAQKQAARAMELRQDYRTQKSGVGGEFSDTLARWNLITIALRKLTVDHKFSVPGANTLDDISNAKDLPGLFILRTLANEVKVKHLQEMLDASGEEAQKKAAGKKALEEAVQNTALILKGMDKDPAMFALTPVIPKPGKEPRVILDDIEKKLFELHQTFDKEEPKRVENHLEGLEKVSALATEFIFKYGDTDDFKELKNDLNKFKIYPFLNAELNSLKKKQEMLGKLEKTTKSLGRLPKDQRIKRIDQLYQELEIARIAGVFSELKAGKPNEN